MCPLQIQTWKGREGIGAQTNDRQTNGRQTTENDIEKSDQESFLQQILQQNPTEAEIFELIIDLMVSLKVK